MTFWNNFSPSPHHHHHKHHHHHLWNDLLHQLCPPGDQFCNLLTTMLWPTTTSTVSQHANYNLFLFQARILLQHLCWLHFWPDRSISEQHQWKSFLCFSIAAALKRAHWRIRGHSVQLLWRPPFKCSPESFSERLARPLATHIWYISVTPGPTIYVVCYNLIHGNLRAAKSGSR